METVSTFDVIRRQYAFALGTFFMPFGPEAKARLRESVLMAADELATTVNWQIGTIPMIRTNLWTPLRQDVTLHTTLTKIERLVRATLIADGVYGPYKQAIQAMVDSGANDTSVVDASYDQDTNDKMGFSVSAIPGVEGFLSVLLFRDVWSLLSQTQTQAVPVMPRRV